MLTLPTVEISIIHSIRLHLPLSVGTGIVVVSCPVPRDVVVQVDEGIGSEAL